MKKIRIVKVPSGQAPEWVRREWVGLILPLAQNVSKIEKVIGVLGGEVDNADQYIDGYSVETAAAVIILNEKSPEAAKWWLENVSFWFVPRLIFRKEDCELIEEKKGRRYRVQVHKMISIDNNNLLRKGKKSPMRELLEMELNANPEFKRILESSTGKPFDYRGDE